MATLITVHGTFAHMGGTAPRRGSSKTNPSSNANEATKTGATNTSAPASQNVDQWWAEDSAFAEAIRKDVQAADGDLNIKPFVWSGDNSETVRRREGARLFHELRQLEKAGETYCLIGHSHGGSVISHALLYAAANKTDLPGLQKWLTVGTPFIHLRKERFLFLRLPLVWKAMFVASMMLFLMLLFFLVGQLIDGGVTLSNNRQAIALGIAVLLTALPFAVFYVVSLVIDMRQLYGYRKSTIKRAQDWFATKWVALTHEDDEAVNGLSSLRTATPSIFHSTFAVPAFTVFSAFILPLIYLYVVMSPSIMVAIANSLRDNVYAMEAFEEQRTKLTADEQELRSLRRSIRRAREELEDSGDDIVKRLEAETRLKTLRKLRSAEREKIVAKYDDLPQIKRVERFKRRFLEENGKPCANNTLCGAGEDIILNSRLLFHLVTDEVASLVIDDEYRRGIVGHLIRFVVPVLLVPVFFGLLAVAIVFLMQAIATGISSVLSKVLDKLTWFEVKRSAMGNDTETEVVVQAERYPPWMEAPKPFLPAPLSEKLTNHSNEMSARSLAKFRNAISEIMVADEDEQAANILSFLTWQELIHTAYFEVTEFRKLIAHTLVQTDAFQPTIAFANDPGRYELATWLSVVNTAASTPTPDDTKEQPRAAAAVA
ncbi:MAG: hypothetical protein AAFV45_01075 [Pseudomonadota bacterium]